MAAETALKVAHYVVKSADIIDETDEMALKIGLSLCVELSLDEGGYQDGVEDGSSLGAVLSFDEGSEDDIKDGSTLAPCSV
jgi:hypothetical protein